MAERATFLEVRQRFRLECACAPIVNAFGLRTYLVGSCLSRPDYRDVDVRTILDDDEFARMFPGVGSDKEAHRDPRWMVVCSPISDWLSAASGLPVDYQIQAMSWANEMFEGARHALGITIKGIGDG